MKHPILLAVLVSAAMAPSAVAAPFTPQLNYVYDLAIRHWGGEPLNCTGIERQVVDDGWLNQVYPPHLYGPESIGGGARATQPPADASVPCVLFFERSLARLRNIDVACMTMVHEVGHLHGYGHDDTPASVMNRSNLVLPGICRPLFAAVTARFDWEHFRSLCRRGELSKPGCWRSVRKQRVRMSRMLDRIRQRIT